MTESRKPVIYRSAVDGWLVVVVALGPLVATGFGIYALLQGKPGDGSILFLAGGFAMCLTLAFMIPCRYTLLEDALSIRCGVIFYQVALVDIEDVTKSSSILSGPALSFRRVCVKTKRRGYLISPEDRDAFIDDLRAAIAGLH